MLKKALDLCNRAKIKSIIGSVESSDNISKLEKTLNITFPFSLKEVYINIPIIGLETSYHQFKPTEDWVYSSMIWMDVEEIVSEVNETETGSEMLKKRFIPIGMDVSGGGDYYYIDLNNNKLPLYKCYHDNMTLSKISDSIENVFEFALVE